jgi:hypothetical protein
MIHVKVWTGSGSAAVIDMTHAGKRGKTCDYLRIVGTNGPWVREAAADVKAAEQGTNEILYTLSELAPGCEHGGQVVGWSFDVVEKLLLSHLFDAKVAGANPTYLNIYKESIKAITAPRPVLTAGVEGKWSASCDVQGIHMRQLDDVNEWSEITPHDQTGPRAYELASKVWAQVKRAGKMGEAADILRNAGCRLHGYCAMD